MHILVSFIMIFMLLFSSNSFAKDRAVPSSQQQIMLSYAPLVKKTAPAVVNIYTKMVVEQRGGGFNPFFDDPFFRQFFGQQFLETPMRKRIENALGSGVIVDKSGLIITNAHVVKNAKEIVAILSDGEEFKAKIILIDERTDMAVLKINTDSKNLPYIKFANSDNVEVGDLVLAIGNPFGVGQTVTSGIVSATSRTAAGVSDFNFFIQTDAAINPGNSGGALINMSGELIGINSAIYSKNGGYMGIGFAIPSNMAKVIVHAVKTDGKLIRSWFGVSAQAITNDIVESLDLENNKGAIITYIHPASPAKDAGLKLGDIVKKINGYSVELPAELRFRSAMVEVGNKINLEILRNGKTLNIEFTAITAPEDVPRNTTILKGYHPFNNVTVANLSPALADEIGNIPMNAKGVVILKSASYGRISFKEGDIIKSVNKVKIKNVKQLKKLLKKKQRYWNIVIDRRGQMINITISG